MAEEGPSQPLSQRLSEIVEGEVERNDQPSSHIPQAENVKRRKLRSQVWKDFNRILKDDGTYVAKCLACQKELSGDSKMGTTHLRLHLVHCVQYKRNNSKQPKVGQALLRSVATKNEGNVSLESFQFSQELSRDDLAKMIIVHEIPFSFVEHAFFRTFCSSLQPLFKSISRNTLKSECIKVYEREKQKVYDMLKMTPSRVSITADLWTSVGTVSYLSLTCHFIDKDWNLQKRILNFVNVKSHSGVEIAKVIKAKLFDWNIDGKICSIVLDNAFSNNVLTRELCSLLKPRGRLLLDGALFRVRCCCHILNLIVQVGLGPLESTISKIRDIVKHVRGSHIRLECFKKSAEQVGAPKKKLVLDVPTRWNSTYMMISVAYEFRDAFDRLSYFDTEFKDPPSFEEWESVKVAKDCLQLFYQVTTRFSGTKYPTANLYFNDVCLIHYTLKKWLRDSHPFIVSMAARMLEKFNKYWGTLSLVLSIGCILDPRYKLKSIEFFFEKIYIEDHGMEAINKISEVRMSFIQLYNVYQEEQRKLVATTRSVHNDVASSSVNSSLSTMDCAHGSLSSCPMVVDELLELDQFLKENSSSQSVKSDLELYLDAPVLSNDVILKSYGENFDILAWWKEEGGKYPVLAMMARDILGIPISTVASESAFSTGGRILDCYRSCLKPSTVESLICSQDWLRPRGGAADVDLSTIPLASNLDAEIQQEDMVFDVPLFVASDENNQEC